MQQAAATAEELWPPELALYGEVMLATCLGHALGHAKLDLVAVHH
jgi:hypothetical protein